MASSSSYPEAKEGGEWAEGGAEGKGAEGAPPYEPSARLESPPSYTSLYAQGGNVWVGAQFQRCESCQLDRNTGELRYTSENKQASQLIGAWTVQDGAQFDIKIVSCGKDGSITMGLVHGDFLHNAHPGWYEGSIGYHADDGGLFHSAGRPLVAGENAKCAEGDTMSCKVTFSGSFATVEFSKNGGMVYRRRVNRVLPWYPAVGMRTEGAVIRLGAREAWMTSVASSSGLPYYGWSALPKSQMVHCSLKSSRGVLSHCDKKGKDGLLLSMKRLTPPTTFSIEVVGLGKKGDIRIGIYLDTSDENKFLSKGWIYKTLSYRGNDGGYYLKNELRSSHVNMVCAAGDRLTCSLTQKDDKYLLAFYRNGFCGLASNLGECNFGVDRMYAAVGLHSPGEAVRLLGDDVWI